MNSYNNIPECLKKLDRWVCWRVEDRGGKQTKVPINPLTGGRAMSNNPATWGTFYDAIECLDKTTELKGIGFMFNGDGILGVDLDHCRNPETGTVEDFAKEIISTLDSYTETSQSGNGIHILCYGKLPEGKRRKGDVEMYESGRFFVMTGNVVDDAHMDVEDRTEELAAVHKKYLSDTKKAKIVNNSVETVLNLDENEIIQKAMNAKNGSLFSKLYSGSWKGIYGSQSEADMAFCNMLAFWCGRDYTMMDRIFRKSGMYRDKWDEKRGQWTYGEKTLNEAINGCSEVYTSSRKAHDYIAKNFRNIEDAENMKSSTAIEIQRVDEKNQKPIIESEVAKEEPLIFNGVQESWGGYVRICKTNGEDEGQKKVLKKPITNFVIEPVQLVVSEDGTELKAFIKYNFRKIPITLTANNFASPRDFKSAIGAILGPSSGWFDGKQNELTGIQRIIDNKEVNRVKGVKASGFHFIDNRWVYVTGKGGISDD